MDIDTFIEIMESDVCFNRISRKSCNVYDGISLLRKYIPDVGVEGASHDIIYSVDVDAIVNAGITVEDTEILRELCWSVENGEYLRCDV